MRSLLNSALVVSLLCALSAAQTAQPSSPKSRKIPAQKPGAGREITPQQERAISVLNNLFERTKEFADDKTRIETQAQIADTLWEYDQQTARRQFTEAFRSIERIEDEERPFPVSYTPKTLLRLRLSDLLAKPDADLAEKLINSIPESQTKTDQTSPTKKRGERGNLYMKLADELMMDLFEIGRYFMADYEESAGHNDAGQKDEAPAEPEPIKPVLVEPLLNFAFKAITIESANEQSRMSNGQKQERMVMFDMIDHGIVEWLLPLFEQHQPERAAFIRSHLGHIENVIPSAVHQAMNTPRPTTVKELLDEAQTKKDSFQKDMLYAEAARKAEEAGDFDQAIAIMEKLSDKSLGKDVSLIRNSAAINAGDKGDIDAAYRYAITLPDPSDQVRALCRIALKSFEKRDLQRANELINEAEKMIANSGPTPEKVFALLDVSAAATTINPVGGFEFVNTAIAVINQIHSSKPNQVG